MEKQRTQKKFLLFLEQLNYLHENSWCRLLFGNKKKPNANSLKKYTEHSSKAQQNLNKWSLSSNGRDTFKNKNKKPPTAVLCNSHYIFSVNISLYENLWQPRGSGASSQSDSRPHRPDTSVMEIHVPARTLHHLVMSFLTLVSMA